MSDPRCRNLSAERAPRSAGSRFVPRAVGLVDRRARIARGLIAALGAMLVAISPVRADEPVSSGTPPTPESGTSGPPGNDTRPAPSDSSADSPRRLRHAAPAQAPTASPSTNALYFYFTPDGCAHCRSMARVIQRLYEDRQRGAGDAMDVFGVPIAGSAADIERFRRATGFTVPLAEDPKIRPINLHEHPVGIFYNTASKVHSIASVGFVPYSTMVAARSAFSSGRPVRPEKGPA